MSRARIWPGKHYPLGARFDGSGTNFAVFSEHAERVELSLFDPHVPSRELERYVLPECTTHIWHGYVPDVMPGALYGYRVHGVYDPDRGLRFNPNKVLVDPYVRAVFGKVDWEQPVFGHRRDLLPEDVVDLHDSAAGAPKGVVVADQFDWEGDRRPGIPWSRTVLYELHVKGFTMRHPKVPAALRGTYAALATPAVISHLQSLGVTAVELMPVHEAIDDGHLVKRGLRNYWGYNTLAYFAPDQRYSSRGGRGGQVADFKSMVKALHAANIEVILDVVYNHTGEGNQLGPTLSLRGLDNSVFYRLDPSRPRDYEDFTGCGNSLRVHHHKTLKLVMDSLRYWAEEMRVDGFRFDLATTLGRDNHHFDANAGFFKAMHQDPVLSRLKLIAEPWDLGPEGYRAGQFPIIWSEQNDRYRDSVRRFWRGGERLAELGYRLTGSSDLYKLSGRRPRASVNYVASHDGMTLHDLVTYAHKHNEANGESNRDGAPDDFSANYGVEGETGDEAVGSVREQQKRNLLATLLLSQGVPMLCGGDEMGRTQRGNNNAYCHDDELSWINWELGPKEQALLDFTRRLVRLRMQHPVLMLRSFLRGSQVLDSKLKDVTWLRPDGEEMARADWDDPSRRALGFLLGGDALEVTDERGERVFGETLLVLLNAHDAPVGFRLPRLSPDCRWQRLIDSSAPERPPDGAAVPGETVPLAPRSLLVLARLDGA